MKAINPSKVTSGRTGDGVIFADPRSLWGKYLKYAAQKLEFKFELDKILKVYPKLGQCKSSKDIKFWDLAVQLQYHGLLSLDGSVYPIPSGSSLSVGAIKIISLYDSEVGMVKAWTGRPGKPGRSNGLNRSSVDVPYTPVIGRFFDKEGFAASRESLLKKIMAIPKMHPLLLKFEESELYPSGLTRGLFFPVMMNARLATYDSSLFSQKLQLSMVPSMDKFSSLRNVDEVIIANPNANVGFWTLGKFSDEMDTLKRESNFFGDIFSKHYSPTQLLNLSHTVPPHAVGKRAQSYGRAIIMPWKILFFLLSLTHQPLTAMLEGQSWYAGGDRLGRLTKMRKVIDGESFYCADGDDIIRRLGSNIICADYSAYESSLRSTDISFANRLLAPYIRNKTDWNVLMLNHNLNVCSMAKSFASGLGMICRSVLQGKDSGIPSTHTDETIINASMQEHTLSLVDLDEWVLRMGQYGREIRESAQMVNTKGDAAVLAKLFCDGQVIHGSVIRAFEGLCVTEGPWSVPKGMTVEQWMDQRSCAIVANCYDHPASSDLISLVRSSGFRIVGDKKTIVNEALKHMDKSRGPSNLGSKPTGVLERKALAWAFDELS